MLHDNAVLDIHSQISILILCHLFCGMTAGQASGKGAKSMTLSQLRVLLAVADRGGFTLAAEQLGMSQPAVSRAVATLETELGAALLARHRDGVTLTEAGQRAVAHIREALRHVDLLHAEVAAIAGEVTGTLRLASLPSATGTLIAAQLRAFADRYPQVHVRLFEGTDEEVREWLDQGAAEVGVVTLPAPGLHTVELGTDEMVAVLPSAHELAGKTTVAFTALANEPFILATGGCGPLILAAARNAGACLDIAFEARELTAILEMVGTGLGVSIVPTLGLPNDVPSIVTRPLEPRTPRTLALASGSHASSAPAARAFLDQVAKSGPAPPRTNPPTNGRQDDAQGITAQ
jgi:DNA-binding transcriptional LysR family regulator